MGQRVIERPQGGSYPPPASPIKTTHESRCPEGEAVERRPLLVLLFRLMRFFRKGTESACSIGPAQDPHNPSHRTMVRRNLLAAGCPKSLILRGSDWCRERDLNPHVLAHGGFEFDGMLSACVHAKYFRTASVRCRSRNPLKDTVLAVTWLSRISTALRARRRRASVVEGGHE
jgi:hypothetical protein